MAAPDGKGKVDDYWDPAKKMMRENEVSDDQSSALPGTEEATKRQSHDNGDINPTPDEGE